MIYAVLMTNDQLLEITGQTELIRFDVPTWAEFTGWYLGGNQNTIRYAHIDSNDYKVDRLPAYRQIADLGNEHSTFSQAEWKKNNKTNTL